MVATPEAVLSIMFPFVAKRSEKVPVKLTNPSSMLQSLPVNVKPVALSPVIFETSPLKCPEIIPVYLARSTIVGLLESTRPSTLSLSPNQAPVTFAARIVALVTSASLTSTSMMLVVGSQSFI